MEFWLVCIHINQHKSLLASLTSYLWCICRLNGCNSNIWIFKSNDESPVLGYLCLLLCMLYILAVNQQKMAALTCERPKQNESSKMSESNAMLWRCVSFGWDAAGLQVNPLHNERSGSRSTCWSAASTKVTRSVVPASHANSFSVFEIVRIVYERSGEERWVLWLAQG